MEKTLITMFLLCNMLFAQQNEFAWPYYIIDNTAEPVQKINSNMGDYRNTNRFHLGVDVQEEPNTQVFPIHVAQLVTNPLYDATDQEYTFILQHGIYNSSDNPPFTPLENSYSVYTHLRNISTLNQ